MGCDCGLGENPALGARNQVWTLLHLHSHVGGSQVPCELAGQAIAGADTRGQRHLAAPRPEQQHGPRAA